MEAHVVGGVLIGGQSRRMGRPKALLAHPRGGTLIEHVFNTVSSVAPDVVLLGGGIDLPVSLKQSPVLSDPMSDAGPKSGLLALLRYAGERWVWLVSCDMALLSASVFRRMWDVRLEAADAVAFATDGWSDRLHACCALYHGRIADVVTKQLTSGDLRMQSLRSAIRMTVVTPTDAERRSLANVNSPADYQAITP